MLIKWIFIASIIFSYLSCSNKSSLIEVDILKKLVYSNNSDGRVKITFGKTVNLDDSPDLEYLIVSNDNSKENLSLLKKEKENWKLLNNYTFQIPNKKSYTYNSEKKQWQEGEEPEKSIAIKRLLVEELPGIKHNSIFIELLSEDSILGLHSNLLIINHDKIIFDGRKFLKNHPYLLETKKIEFEYLKQDKSIKLFSHNFTYSQEIIYNGWEMVPLLSGMPIPSILEFNYKKGEKEGEFEFHFFLKNRGSLSRNSYLTFSFDNEDVEVKFGEKAKGYKFYKKSDPVFSLKEKKHFPATGTFLEITKEEWGSNYKYNVHFTLKTPRKGGYILFRSSSKLSSNIMYTPNEFSSADTTKDNQGFPCYKFEFGEKDAR